MPSWLKAALITSAQTFAASFLIALLGVLDEINDWAANGNPPDLSAFGALVVGAATAAVAGLITAVHRGISPPEVTYPDPPPG